MAVLICLAGAYVALSVPVPSWANDEAPHLGYVVTLAHGDLPTIDSPIVDDPQDFPPGHDVLIGWDEAHRDIWTANHPPLYHVLLVPVWWLTGDDLTQAVISMRLANTVGFGVWVLLVGLVARELVPRRPAVAALASVIAATPSLTMRAGFLMNDGWASAAALLVVLMTGRMLRGGRDSVTVQRVVVATLAGVFASGTRASGVLVVATCSVALLIALRGDRRGIAAATALGGVPAAATAWFYLRNLRLYGDVTGQDALLDKFDRSPVSTLTDLATPPGLWEAVQTTAIPILVLLVFVPTVVMGWLRQQRHRAWRPDPLWCLLVVHALLTAVNLAGFIRHGGGFHDRYLMTVMPLLATVSAVGMLSLPRRGRRDDWRTSATWAAALVTWLVGAFAYLEWRHVPRQPYRSAVEGPWPIVLLLAAAAMGVLVTLTLSRTAGPRLAARVPVLEDLHPLWPSSRSPRRPAPGGPPVGPGPGTSLGADPAYDNTYATVTVR